MKVLIVDDSAIVRRAIERHLRSGKVREILQAATAARPSSCSSSTGRTS